MKNEIIEKYNRPVFFYGLSLVIPWVLWFGAGAISHIRDGKIEWILLQGILSLLGLLAPVFVALYLFLTNKELLIDLRKRFFRIKGFSILYSLLALGLIFSSMVLAQLISLLFGYSIDQFIISGTPSFNSVLFSPWLILILAPIVEELAWHSYGTDTFRRKFNLFLTSILFAFYWVFWHLPLSTIDGYYHSNVMAEGWMYSLNFVVSLFVFVILMNWLYFKTNRNIFLTIIFHLTANISNEIFATHPDSKLIQTGILTIVVIIVLIKERTMFFSNEIQQSKE